MVLVLVLVLVLVPLPSSVTRQGVPAFRGPGLGPGLAMVTGVPEVLREAEGRWAENDAFGRSDSSPLTKSPQQVETWEALMITH